MLPIAQTRLRFAAVTLTALLSACVSPAETPSPTPMPPTPSPSPTATPTATATATPTDSPTPAPSPTPPTSGFEVEPNEEADALFALRDICISPEAGYQLEYPELWWTNTEVGDFPACVWYSPTFYEVPDETQRPAEIAIEIIRVDGERTYPVEPISRQEGEVGSLPAFRVEVPAGAAQPASFRAYEYVVQLGPSFDAGPNLVARTDTTMGGDYALNRAVLDRIMASLEFIGSTQ